MNSSDVLRNAAISHGEREPQGELENEVISAQKQELFEPDALLEHIGSRVADFGVSVEVLHASC